MKATEAKLLEFLKKSPQFVIPIYQRTYSWTQRECRQIWDDIMRTGQNDEVSAHFVGAIVYIEKGLYQVTSQSPLLVIDGQQRLTTITLLLAALARALDQKTEDNREPLEGFSPRKLRNYYLLNPEEEGERRHKLILSQTDKDSLIALVDGLGQPAQKSLPITNNSALFDSWIADCDSDLTPLCKGLAKLVVVDIALSRDQDNPQLIFESMNSTGRELTQADLIRNFILMRLEPQRQEQLYKNYWRPMEVEFGQAAYTSHFDGFMRHYLTLRTGEIPNVRGVYDAFKTYALSSEPAKANTEALVHDIHTYAGYFCKMALGAETDPDLNFAFHDLRELKVDVAYPFLMELYHDYATAVLSQSDFLQALRLIEAYVFRRAICGMPPNALNKTFATFSKSLNKTKDCYLKSIKAHLLNMLSYQRLPPDDEFVRSLQTRDLYNFPRRSYWLRRIENYLRKERVGVGEYTIEHIMPQNEKLSDAWQKALGTDWERVWKTWLHTLGNLTLTGYNSEYSDNPFPKKRDMQGGFKESPIKLNAGLGTLENWNEDAIKVRAERLAQVALCVWPAPSLSAEERAAYKPPAVPAQYTIADHPKLASGAIGTLFEAFRKEVLALDPCMTEEFLKHYVAYKAETNVVDVAPQAKQLRLTLNAAFADIDDPKKICHDVTAVGHLGNGDALVRLSSMDEMPYVIGLVRQALEKQMDATNGNLV